MEQIIQVILVCILCWLLVMSVFHIGRRSVIKYPLGFLDSDKSLRPNRVQRFVAKYPLISALFPAMIFAAIIFTVGC